VTTKTTYYCWHTSPVGTLLLAGSDDALSHISFPRRELANGGSAGGKFSPLADWQEDATAFTHTKKQLDQYFSRELMEFDLSLEPQGTDFQQQVWQALIEIPYGGTVAYRDIAELIDKPKAVRAVGNANGRNPIPIVIPCHRVVGKDETIRIQQTR